MKFNHNEDLVCAGSQSGALKIWDLEQAKSKFLTLYGCEHEIADLISISLRYALVSMMLISSLHFRYSITNVNRTQGQHSKPWFPSLWWFSRVWFARLKYKTMGHTKKRLHVHVQGNNWLQLFKAECVHMWIHLVMTCFDLRTIIIDCFYFDRAMQKMYIVCALVQMVVGWHREVMRGLSR